MASGSDPGVAALVYDYLSKTAGNVAEVFKSKVKPVSYIVIIKNVLWKHATAISHVYTCKHAL